MLLHVPTSRGCNNRCVFCMEYGRGVQRRFTSEEFRQQLERARSFTDEVVFTSGEPTLEPNLEPAVADARTLGFTRIGLITNGRRLCDEDLCSRLFDAGLTEITVSIHGSDAGIHDGITGRPGSFDETLAALSNIARLRRDRDLTLASNCTLVRSNLCCMKTLWELLQGFGVDSLNFNTVEPRGRASDGFDDVVPRYDEVLEAADDSGLDFQTPRVSLSRIPACAGGVEWIQEDFHFTHGEHVTHFDPAEGKVRGEICGRCTLIDRCAGVWERYIEGFGWEGLYPVAEPLSDDHPPLSLDLADGSGGRALRRGWLGGHRRLCLERPFQRPGLPRVIELARSLGYGWIEARTNGEAIASVAVMRRVAELGIDRLVFLRPGFCERAVLAASRVGIRWDLD